MGTDGITMRSALESLVKMKVAEQIATSGNIIFLKASVRDNIFHLRGAQLQDTSRGDRGRIDIAVYYKSRGKRAAPRLVFKIKKLPNHHSLDQDHSRIV